MKTAKEKATELVSKFQNTDIWKNTAKKCAIIAVDEIINALPSFDMVDIQERDYWQEVKKEIELL